MANEGNPGVSGLRSDLAYVKLVDDILSGIRSGELQVGDRIASETELKRQYGISITSIKRGLATLVDQGMLIRRRGSGTYVAKPQAPPPQLVRRDAVALLRMWDYWRFHPYFTERLRGIQSGLAQYGLKVIDIQAKPPTGNQPEHEDITYRPPLTPEFLEHAFARRPELAGAIILDQAPALPQALLDQGIKMVTGQEESTAPTVAYDWDLELERLFRMALERDARNVAVFGSFDEARLRRAAERARKALDFEPAAITQHYFITEASRLQSITTSRAYDQALQAYAATGANYDALIVTSDLDAQGVVDALLRLPRKKWQGTPLFCLYNKESRFHASLPLYGLEVDGKEFGLTLANLLHEHLTSPETAPNRITMRCREVQS